MLSRAPAGKGYVTGRATTFGYQDPKDPGVGAPKLGGINTNEASLVGVAIPEEVLRQRVGATPAQWRKARVEVVAKDGRHMLVPIVDLGPGDEAQSKGVAVDFTHGLSTVLGHSDENSYQFKIVPDAGVDVTRDPQAFVAEQRLLAKGTDTRPKQPSSADVSGGYVLAPETPEEQQDAAKLRLHDDENKLSQAQRLNEMGQKAGNLVGLYKDLSSKPPENMSPAIVKAYTDNLQQVITREMQKRFPDMSPEVAWKKAQEDSSLWDIGSEFWHQGTGAFSQLAPVFAQRSPDKENVDTFLSQALPGASDADKHAWLSKYYALPQEQRGPFIASSIPGAIAGQRGNDPMMVYAALEHLADPNFQKAQADKLAQAREYAAKARSEDPRLSGTVAEDFAKIAPMAEQAFAYYGIPIIGAAQASEETRARMKQEHPDWSEDELDQKSAFSSLAAVYGNTVANALMTRGAGLLLTGLKTPAKRALGQVLAGTLSNVGLGVGTSAATNLAEGKPVQEGLAEAARAGAIQGLIPGLVHGGFEMLHRPPAAKIPVAPEVRLPPLPVSSPEATTGPKGAPIRGASDETLAKTAPTPEAPVPVEQQIVPQETIVSPEATPVREMPEPAITDEESLNRQTEKLYQQHQAELESRVEPEQDLADIIKRERAATELGERPTQRAEAIAPEEGPARIVQTGRPEDYGTGVEPERDLGRGGQLHDVSQGLEEKPGNVAQIDWTHPQNAEHLNVANRVREEVRPAVQALGARLTDKSGRNYAHYSDTDFRVNLDPKKLAADSIEDGLSHDQSLERIRAVADEELTHAADLLSARREWEARDPRSRPSFKEHLTEEGRQVVKELFAAHDAGNARAKKFWRDVVESSYNAYNFPGKGKRQVKFKQIRAELEASPDSARRMRGEVNRQLIQAQRHNNIRELVPRTLLGRLTNWLKKTLVTLQRAYSKVRGGEAGPTIARAIRKTEAELDGLNAIWRGHRPSGEGVEFGERGPEEEAGGGKIRAGGPRAAIGAGLQSSARWLSAVFKSGESAMLDYKETQPLALAMRRRPSLEQKFGQRAQVMQLADVFNKVKAADRPRVVKEFTDYVRAEQNRQPLPPVSADTRAILDAGKNTLEQLGQISRELNVHVRTSDGKIRPMKLIGRDYYPRMISDDMRDIFNHRDDTRAAEFNNVVNRQIARGVVKSRDEFIDKFTQAVTPDRTSNGHFGNIEKARETQLPLEFYDFSPEALIKYANRSTDRLAQISAYGQKLSSKGKDLFDHTIEQVQRASGYSHTDKQTIINRIEQERKAEYQEREKSNLGKVSSLARSGASGAFLGNPITSAYNLIGGAGQNLTFGGPGAFFKTAAKFATIKGALENIKEARERNILKSNLSDILTDYDLVTNQGWATKGVQGFTKNMLKWGGQNLSEGINRAFAMQQGKYILNRFARLYGQDNASARSLYAMINRRGIHDLQGLAREKGQGPLTDEFLRQFVMDVHGNYGPSQSAAHIFDTDAGKVLLQFQKWGANTQRMATREFLMPLVKAARDRQPADFAYHLMRNLGYIAAATGTGAASQFFSNWARDKDPRKPSIGEIYTRFAHGENWKALQYALQRAQDMIILSGFAGTLGNYSDLAGQLTGANPGGRVKDPLHPPVVSLFQPFQELAQGWAGEGGKAPSPRILDQFLQSTLSAYRVGKQTLLTGANAAGLRFKPGEEMAARNDLAFLRNRVKMFEDDNPEFKAKRELRGTQAMSFAGRSQFDPYKDRIQAALLTGHPEEANLAVADWLDRFPAGEQEARRKSIQQSVQASSPIKPGGSYKLDTELQFLSWVKQNLPPEEARKIFATAQTYAKTAMDTGILGRSKTMQRIAGIDYDKFVVVTPKATVAVARPTPSNQPTLAEQIRREVAAKKLMLQHR